MDVLTIGPSAAGNRTFVVRRFGNAGVVVPYRRHGLTTGRMKKRHSPGVDEWRLIIPARGGYCFRSSKWTTIYGLSPRSGGVLHRYGNPKMLCGLSPRAGNTASTPAIRRCFADYPRERGRYCFHSSNPKMLCGLSPRAGEILLPLQQSEDALRIIPASGGDTASTPAIRRCFADYPRERGRYCFHSSNPKMLCGLSPRAGEILLPLQQSEDALRIIPASGGDTASTPAIRRCFADYPRVRGRYCFHSSNPKMLCGLSPRAGDTASTPAIRRRFAVYPRKRGR